MRKYLFKIKNKITNFGLKSNFNYLFTSLMISLFLGILLYGIASVTSLIYIGILATYILLILGLISPTGLIVYVILGVLQIKKDKSYFFTFFSVLLYIGFCIFLFNYIQIQMNFEPLSETTSSFDYRPLIEGILFFSICTTFYLQMATWWLYLKHK